MLMPDFKLPEPIKAYPNAMDNTIIYKAQSLLTKNGVLGPILPYEEALEVVRKFEEGENIQ